MPTPTPSCRASIWTAWMRCRSATRCVPSGKALVGGGAAAEGWRPAGGVGGAEGAAARLPHRCSPPRSPPRLGALCARPCPPSAWSTRTQGSSTGSTPCSAWSGARGRGALGPAGQAKSPRPLAAASPKPCSAGCLPALPPQNPHTHTHTTTTTTPPPAAVATMRTSCCSATAATAPATPSGEQHAPATSRPPLRRTSARQRAGPHCTYAVRLQHRAASHSRGRVVLPRLRGGPCTACPCAAAPGGTRSSRRAAAAAAGGGGPAAQGPRCCFLGQRR